MDAHDNILDERECVVVDEFLKKYEWQGININPYRLNPKDTYIPPEYTLEVNGKKFAPLANIQFLTGQTGEGKTFTFTSLMAAIISGQWGGIRYIQQDKYPTPKVIYIDTEQSKGQTQEVQRRVYSMVDWEFGTEHSNFECYMLREVPSPAERWSIIIKIIDEVKPRIVFLDGLIDVVKDFNDNEACNILISELLALSSRYNISLWSVLHENPTSTEQAKKGNGKPAGHLGSYLMRKATDSLRNIKELDETRQIATFHVMQGKVRGEDHGDWSYTIHKDTRGVPIPVWREGTDPVSLEGQDVDTKKDGTFSESDVRNMIDFTMGTESVSFTTLRDKLRERYTIGSGKAKVIINQAVAFGFVVCTDNRYTKIINTNLLDQPNKNDPFA